MKKIALLLAAAISSVSLFAQSVDKGELKQLKAFLAQPAAEASTNAEALKISNQNSPATWEGITVENGHITAINWKDKKLACRIALLFCSVKSPFGICCNNMINQRSPPCHENVQSSRGLLS